MIRRTSALYLILILLTAQTSVAAKLCVAIFPSYKVTAKEQKSIDKSILALAQLKLNLDQIQASGKHPMEFTVLGANYKDKEQELQQYLERQGIMSQAELLQKIKSVISALQNQANKQEADRSKDNEREQKRREQERTLVESIVTGESAIFHRIQPGTFEMGEPGRIVTTQITKPFELMATPTTQTIWNRVLALHLEYKKDHLVLHAMHTFSFPHPLNPVDTKPHDQVTLWIDVLNELSQEGAPELKAFIVGHKTGDVYRLPTEAEWEFVVKGRGKLKQDYYFGNSVKQLEEYAWYNKNSNQSTQPVAQLKPLVLNRKEFYDMLGNVHEWMQDWWHPDLQGGQDPQGPPTGTLKVLRGSSYKLGPEGARSYNRIGSTPSTFSTSVGFRLVREVRP